MIAALLLIFGAARPSYRGWTSDSTVRLAYLFLAPATCHRRPELRPLDVPDELATKLTLRLRLTSGFSANGRSFCRCVIKRPRVTPLPSDGSITLFAIGVGPQAD